MKKRMLLLGISLTALTLAGCNSSGSGGDQTTSPTTSTVTTDANGVAYAGSTKCISCHKDFSWSSEIVDKFLAGKHVNHSTHVDASMGPAGSNCLECHDPIGDGPGLTADKIATNGTHSPSDIAAYDSANNVVTPIPTAGLAAMGCENCHGAGGQHYGVGPMPVPKPDYTSCGTTRCHNSRMPHPTYHPEGVNIMEDYKLSAHGSTTDLHNSAICVRCHTDEGARKYKTTAPFNGMTTAILTAEIQAVPTASNIQCRTCHDAHNPGSLLKAGTSSASAEFLTCTFCHQSPSAVLGDDPAPGTTTDGPSGTSTGLLYHSKRWNRVIASTHYDNPATGVKSALAAPTDPTKANIIEGYVVNPKSERACRDCHNTHSADLTINKQWARSGHGGHLLDKKDAASATVATNTWAKVTAVRAAGSDANEVFAHYDWDAGDRQSCQMCHTATGAKNFMTAPATYDATKNDFSHLSGWKAAVPATATSAAVPVVSSDQNELLYCWACHKDNAGGLRLTGSVTLKSYTYGGQPVVIPNVGSSAVCVNCHGGRGNVDTMTTIVSPATTPPRSTRFAGHHGTAAGTLFSKVTHIGYEYAGLQYDSTIKNDGTATSFKHSTIGTAKADGTEAQPGTGTTTGPCVGCHMPSTASDNVKRDNVPSHTWAIIKTDATTGAKSITSQALCAKCHGTMTVEVIEEEQANSKNALVLLNDYLQNTIPNVEGKAIAANYATVALNSYGALQNYLYLNADEVGAFAHNRKYAKRLVFDAIDWLDNGVLDGTITVDTVAYPGGAHWLGAPDAAEVAADRALAVPKNITLNKALRY